MADSTILTPEDIAKADFETVTHYLQHAPTTSQELYQFLKALTGEPMPFKPCCQNHVAPWAFIWRSYRMDLPEFKHQGQRSMIYVGPRGGHKSLSVAKLIAAELLTKPKCHTVGLGAIEVHAKDTYQNVMRYLGHPAVAEMEMVQKQLMEETLLTNGSKYNQVCATLSGTNGKHPQKLRTEENDLISDPSVMGQAKMMPSTHKGLRAHMSCVSTRKWEDGIMDQLVQKADTDKKADVLISCYKDSAERCTEERHGAPSDKLYEVDDIFNEGKTVQFKAYENCATCPLLKTCRGDLARANGVVSIDDLISEWGELDLETWKWEKECVRGRGVGKYFGFWDDNLNSGHYPYRPDIGWVDLSFDFTGGGEDPTAVGIWQTDGMEAELPGLGKGSDGQGPNDYQIAEKKYDGAKTADFVAKDLYEFLADNGWTRIRFQLGDSAAATWINELNSKAPHGHEKFFKIKAVRKIERVEGWKLFRQRVRDNSGWRHLFVDQSCTDTKREIKNARPSKSDPNDVAKSCVDHFLDQGRYRLVELRWHGLKQPNIRIVGGELEKPEPPKILGVDGKPVQGGRSSGEYRSKEKESLYLPRYLRAGGDDEDDDD